MTEVRFYHRTRTPLDQALPKMLERTLERGQRAVVRAGSEARVEALSARLWTYHDRSFLPHGTVKDGRAERQPVWLTVADDEAPNAAPHHAPNAAPHTNDVPLPHDSPGPDRIHHLTLRLETGSHQRGTGGDMSGEHSAVPTY